ncbi:MAG: peroxiredoxin [Austwickia sp.]|jgi:mycoredoxin-dependent peroxiredoxin|nr:peroxiredoxin [Austwickia sp.]MBK8435172.1 peroxiredoxin [Austwickia sp.]MBK9101274.1 peroxiredoxin [Austwickia sp.]
MTTAPPAIGSVAPDFVLTDQNGRPVRLRDKLAERALLVVFYPFAFSGICTGELQEIRDQFGSFQNDLVDVVAISCDPMFALRAWDDKEAYFFPLLSDFWPHGQVARSYGVFEEQGGFARRGTFLIAQDGTIAWCLVNEPGRRRDFTGFHATLSRWRTAGTPSGS